MCRRLAWCLLLCAGVSHADQPPAAEPAAIEPGAARAVFDQARSLCEADRGRLWGVSLCGPIMLVDPATRQVVASEGDRQGALRAVDGVFLGQLPADQTAANTALDWSGTRWTQLLWPLPDDPALRRVLLSHELFHRIQPQLRVASPQGGDNPHLDSLEGRYLLQLEWRALARALRGTGDVRRAASADALAFRAERYRLFADARRDEAALELNEGLAEYTGVVVGNPDAPARIGAALRDLGAHVDDPGFVRSFAYATGPAYGLLLDAYAPGWRTRLDGEGLDLGSRLRATGEIRVSDDPAAVAGAAARYDGAALWVGEVEREQRRRAQALRNRKRFVDGPVLRLDLVDMRIQFDPTTLQPLEGVGTVYPSMRITDAWGTLEVSDGALLRDDWKAVTVRAPARAAALAGPGWTLRLAPGWRLAAGARAGDFVLAHGPASQPAATRETPGP